MADERALIFQIKLDLDKLQRSLKQAQSIALRFDTFKCLKEVYFVSGITDARMAATSLQQQLRILAEQRNDNAIRAAFVHAEGLQTDIARFLKDPAILKLSTALSHLDAVIDFTQTKLDPTYQRLGAEQKPQGRGISSQERKERCLRLWQAEQGTLRMKNILDELTVLKSLITRNVLLVNSHQLTTSTQARTKFQDTQAHVEERIKDHLKDLYHSVFQPCIPEGELFAFNTPSSFHKQLVRKCDVRKVFHNGTALEDPIVIIASDISCTQAFDILDMYAGWLRERIGAEFTVISLVNVILHLKDAVIALADILPAKDISDLKGLFWTWYQQDRAQFGILCANVKREYPQLVSNLTQQEFGKGL